MAILHYQNGILVPFASREEGETIIGQNNNPSLNQYIIQRADSRLDSDIWTSDLVSSSYVFYSPDRRPSFIRSLEFGNPVVDTCSDENEINLSKEVLDKFNNLYRPNLDILGQVIRVKEFGSAVNRIFGVDELAGTEYGRKLASVGIATVKIYMAHERFFKSGSILRQVRLKGLDRESNNPGGILCDGRPYFKRKAS